MQNSLTEAELPEETSQSRRAVTCKFMREPHQIIVSEKYVIELFNLNYSDNYGDFKIIYANLETQSNLIGIKIFENNKEINSCIIGSEGGSTAIHNNSNLLSYDGIVFCCGNSIIKLTVPTLKLEWKTISDTMTCFEIFYLENDYLIHGELEITRMDRNGKIVWQNGGKDIFTTPEGKKDFYFTENEIIAMDWNYEKYIFDYSGNLKSITKSENINLAKKEKNKWKFWK
ncbi:hypothetical protein D1J36_007970 [Riemerella anatipestifer]|uniref:hypothetical protein n=1 Tax=Riemerella anatipestifer TaxID=34085 RepID=UPI0012AE6A6F|nr:hypothetical protein [Riemerella anatipestifer]USL95209.1 hypothetical protein D1J36_007970 [Riemerella anatipestifer]